jgi:hypothetical protein
MIYKLYKIRYKTPEAATEDNSYLEDFRKIYEKYDVKMIGGGVNMKDPYEVYFISEYKDDADYKDTVAKLQSDTKYVELSKKLDGKRDGVEVITLEGMEY